jgi:calcineurin-like phosphoesterase family protein
MGQIFLTSDLHLSHDKEFVYAARGFQTVEEMNYAIIKNFHNTVRADDDLWILGDLVLGNIEDGKKFLKQLPGRIHVVCGNHDSAQRIRFYQDMGWDCQDALMDKWNGQSIYLSHFPALTGNFDPKPLKREVINLHGHTHQTSNFTTGQHCMYHVGVDSHNCYPVSFDQIMEELQEYRRKEGIIV